jgi:uncharacterized protein
VTGRSASLASHDLTSATDLARDLGARHEIVDTGELGRPLYRANRGDRCFHCRTELFETLKRIAQAQGFKAVAYGAIKDDESDHRPGMRAAAAHGIVAPLLDAGLSKRDVRAIASAAGLALADKPAGACLASRIPVGTEVTRERLGQVERAEAALSHLGLGRLRVRHHGPVARLELDPELLARLADPEIRRRVVEGVRAAGFRFVTLDLAGYRPGGSDPGSLESPVPDGGQ